MRTLTLDIVDYPGEWLLDLPLLGKSYEQWSAETLAYLRRTTRPPLPAAFLERVAAIDPLGPADEYAAIEAARLFTDHLQARRQAHQTLSMIGPGRFLMPGDLAGSPALTFAPLALPGDGEPAIRHGLGDDAPALRFLSRRRGAAVLPRSFRAPRPADRAGRCAGRARRRPRGDARSAGRHGRGARMLSGRSRRLAQRAVFAPRRSHPVRRDQGRSVAPLRP